MWWCGYKCRANNTKFDDGCNNVRKHKRSGTCCVATNDHMSLLWEWALLFVKSDEYDFEDFCSLVGVSSDIQKSPAGVLVETEYRLYAYVHEWNAIIANLMEHIAVLLVPPPLPRADPVVSTAENKQYIYRPVKLDDKKIREGDLAPFFNGITPWLYWTHLGTFSNEHKKNLKKVKHDERWDCIVERNLPLTTFSILLLAHYTGG